MSNKHVLTTKNLLGCTDLNAVADSAVEILSVGETFSQAVIFSAKLREGVKLIKITPHLVLSPELYNMDTTGYMPDIEVEIRVLKVLNEKITNQGKSPCILNLEAFSVCDGLTDKIEESSLDCEKILRDTRALRALDPPTEIRRAVCHWLGETRRKRIKNKFTIEILERCHFSFLRFFRYYKDTVVEFIIFKSLLFMIIYTLYKIQKKFPGFRHYDLHVDNILLKQDPDFKYNPLKPQVLVFADEGVEFSVPYFGLIPKLIDFGLSVIPELNIKPISHLDRTVMDDRFDNDLMRLLYDIHEFLGGYSRIDSLLVKIDPKKIYAENPYRALKADKEIRSLHEIIHSSTWKEYSTFKPSSEQIYAAYNE
jgi:hypothetical protein